MKEANNIKGLSSHQVLEYRQQHGSNSLEMQEDRVFCRVLKDIAVEPMFILLFLACLIYFIVRQYNEGIIMAVAIVVCTCWIEIWKYVKWVKV